MTDAVEPPKRSMRERLFSDRRMVVMLLLGIASGLPFAVITGARAEPNLLYSSASQTNLDRNSVDMDRERAAFADNSVKYEATLRFINGNVRTMLDAIKGQ